MGVVKRLIKIVLLVAVVAIVIFLYKKNFEVEKGLKVSLWDNGYNENNITFFYEDMEVKESNENIEKLRSTFNVKELISTETQEIDKVLKTVDILKSIITNDDVAETNINNGYDILMEIGERKKVSERDMAIIERDILLAAGFKSRVGEFRKEKPQFQSNPSYYVVEYFSLEYNKWIMIDFQERAYLKEENTPVSSIDIIGMDFKNLTYVGNNDIKEYKKTINKFLSSYTIAIDNTVEYKKSNSFVTYYSGDKDIDLKKGKVFIAPTIYTSSKDMFIKSPVEIGKKDDKKPYLIIMKKPVNEVSDYTFVIGAFKNGSVINDYYIRVNNKEMTKVSTIYYEVKLELGNNIIELSQDGKEVTSKVEILREE